MRDSLKARTLRAWPVLVVATLLQCGVHAAMGPVPLEALVEGADLIIYGQVGALHTSERVAESTLSGETQGVVVEVRATITRLQAIKGDSPDSIVVTTLAGMEDHPVFEVGETAVLFLVCGDDGATWTTMALSQGKFDVREGVVVRESLGVNSFLDKIKELLRPTAPTLGMRFP
jgi:hypothetical protein